ILGGGCGVRRLPYPAEARSTTARYEFRGRLCARRAVGRCGGGKYLARSNRLLVRERSDVRQRLARRLYQRTGAEPDHALGSVSKFDRSRFAGALCLSEDYLVGP